MLIDSVHLEKEKMIAFIIDQGLMVVLFYIINYEQISHFNGEKSAINHFVLANMWQYYLLFMIYQTIFVWLYSASLGKMATNIIVVRQDREKVGFYSALYRSFVRVLSEKFYYLGFVISFFGYRGLALHDKFADTIVIRKTND